MFCEKGVAHNGGSFPSKEAQLNEIGDMRVTCTMIGDFPKKNDSP